MTLAKSKENEIDDINLFFRELSWLADALNMSDFTDADLDEDFELLSKFGKDPEFFIEEIAKHAKSLFWEKLIMNTETLLENCADPKSDTVEFNEKIQEGFSLLEIKSKVKKCNHKKNAIINEEGNTIGSYCSECDIFYNTKGDALHCT